MERKELLKRIKALLEDVDSAPLGGSCGKYYYIENSQDGCLVLSFEGECGYGVSDLKNLRTPTVQKIFDDLAEDYDL